MLYPPLTADSPTRRSSTPSAPSPTPAASTAPRSRWPGCAASPSSPPRSSARTPSAQIDDAVASLEIELTDEEIAALEAPYTPRHDFQGISDDAEMQKIRDRIPGYANA